MMKVVAQALAGFEHIPDSDLVIEAGQQQQQEKQQQVL